MPAGSFISQPMRGGLLRPALAPKPEGIDTDRVGSRRHEERAQHGRLPVIQSSGRSAAIIDSELDCHTMIVKIHPSHQSSLGLPAQLLAPPSRQVTCRVILVPRSLSLVLAWHGRRQDFTGT